MEWVIGILLFLILWTVAGIWRFFISLNELGKIGNDPDPWYEWVIAAPILLIAWIVGRLTNES